VLALLAAAGRRGVSRDKVTAYLWPESDTGHARNLLKQACYALRRDLHAPRCPRRRRAAPESGNHLERHRPAGGRVRHWRFRARGGELHRAISRRFHLAGAAEFERWVETTRSALKARVADALEASHSTPRRTATQSPP